MPDEAAPLTDEERAELEQLRAEKAAREEAQRAAAERAELERLRAEKSKPQQRDDTSRRAAAEDARIREARARGRALMEPGDDLAMPLGQRIVLIAMAVVVLAIVATIVFGPK